MGQNESRNNQRPSSDSSKINFKIPQKKESNVAAAVNTPTNEKYSTSQRVVATNNMKAQASPVLHAVSQMISVASPSPTITRIAPSNPSNMPLPSGSPKTSKVVFTPKTENKTNPTLISDCAKSNSNREAQVSRVSEEMATIPTGVALAEKKSIASEKTSLNKQVDQINVADKPKSGTFIVGRLPPVLRDVRHVAKIENTGSGSSENSFFSLKFNSHLADFENKTETRMKSRERLSKPKSETFKRTSAKSEEIPTSCELTQIPREDVFFSETVNPFTKEKSDFYVDVLNMNNHSKQVSDSPEVFVKGEIIMHEGNILVDFQTENSTASEQKSSLLSPKSLKQEINHASEVNSKLLARHNRKSLPKRVGMKNHGTKAAMSSTLKHVEKLADSLSGFNYCNSVENIAQKSPSKNQFSDIENKDSGELLPLRNYTLTECIFHMKNLEIKDKEIISSIQQSLLLNLQEVNNCMSVLKSCSIISEDILSELDTLRDNLLFFSSNKLSVSSKLSSDGSRSEKASDIKVKKVVEDSKVGSSLKPEYSSQSAALKKDLKSVSETKNLTVENSELEGQSIISLNTFKALLDQLPEELVAEKNYISLQRTLLYCRICEKPLAFALLNLVEHLRGKNHKAFRGIKVFQEEREPLIALPVEEDVLEKNVPLLQSNIDKNVLEENAALSTNYEGVLNIVLNSCKNNFKLDVSVYICIFCDFLSNAEVEAKNHLTRENHNKPELSGAQWHFCEMCFLNIYGTNDHMKKHRLTLQHVEIMKLKNGGAPQKSPLKKDSPINGSEIEVDSVSVYSSNSDASSKRQKSLKSAVAQNSPRIVSEMEEADCASIYSSNSDVSSNGRKRLKPHEILLSIAKLKRDRNSGAVVGLYCQVCNRYIEYKKGYQDDHCSSDAHMKKNKMRDKCIIHHCPTCQVHLFGVKSVWNEHVALSLHIEMSKSVCNINSFVQESESDSDEMNIELSNEEGPHFDVMRSVLSKHLKNESKKGFYGFYCHICEAFSLDDKQWSSHLATASHLNRINSSECAGINMLHECRVCNILLICHENVFTIHKRSLAHEAVRRHQIKASNARGGREQPSTEDDLSDNCGSLDDKNVIPDSNDVRVLEITGLPANTKGREVYYIFKKFGFIEQCEVNPGLKTCRVTFQKNSDAKRVLNMKNIFVKGTPVTVAPAPGVANKGKRRRRVEDVLSDTVMDVLKSRDALKAFVSTLQAEMVDASLQRDKRSEQIRRDISYNLPGCQVHFFGSQVTGLATKQSDFDIYIDFDGLSYYNDVPKENQEMILHRLQSQFTLSTSPFLVTETLLDARVPIMRVVHKKTDTPCDISCRSGLSVENSELVRLYVSLDHRIKWLVVVVKWWMRSNNLLDSCMFTSYATTWLVLFFLMQLPQPVVCSVERLRKACPKLPFKLIASWDCRFSRDIRKCFTINNNQSQFSLLEQFFDFYKAFNFGSTVLCPLTASIIPRHNFTALRVPPAFSLYVERMCTVQNAEKLRLNTPMCVQDPFDLSHNITKGVSHLDLKKFQTLCEQSARLCEKHTSN